MVSVVAPLMGLLGTVTGMIRTFQAITLFGTGDPKMMASGISEALVTTMLGLYVAIPLVLLHALVSNTAKGVVEILDVASTALLEKERLRLGNITTLAEALSKLTHQFDRNQIKRIQDNTSKTRLSILFYAFMWDARKIAEQTKNLLGVFQDPLKATVDTERPDEGAASPPRTTTGPARDAEPEPERVKV